MQQVNVYFNFIGQYVPPHFGERELTAEEIAEQEKIEARRKKLHEAYLRSPEHYSLIDDTGMDRTYQMPKSFVSYRKPRRLTNEQREAARERIRTIRKP